MINGASCPLIMGILNLTPDSFYDGGMYLDPAKAIDRAYQMIEEGADIIDIGGESTRPGAFLIDEHEELRRVLPIVKQLTEQGFPVSVDTSSGVVMQAALELGVMFLNDIRSFNSDAALEAILKSSCKLCIMHMQGQPKTMQDYPIYQNVISEVVCNLSDRVKSLVSVGISRERLIVDPGFGFGKTIAHNFQILSRLQELSIIGLPILVGLSRKSMLSECAIELLLHDNKICRSSNNIQIDAPKERLLTSVAAALIAVQNGANILRVHDVKATKSALRVLAAVQLMAN